MSHDNLTYEDLLQIVELIKSSEQFSEFRLKIGEIEIEVRRARGDNVPISDATEAPTVPAAPSKAANARGDVSAGGATTATDAPTKPSPRRPPALPPGSIVVSAPMVGTFYRSPAPGAAPFVEVGQAVDEHTTVCIIEVMKLMNSIPAGACGRVQQVLVADGAPVDTGAPLIVLDPQ
ncbi:MAG TPA: acetyl-CoA carboxylase biotin carboxyl carrier protein [Casimicrobiaceae bacterium]